MFVSDPLHFKKKLCGDIFLPKYLKGENYVGCDGVILIRLLAQEYSNGHAPLSKTPADKNDERLSLVKSGWDKLGGKAMYLWVTPCLPNESVQQRCNLSEQSQASEAMP